MPAADPASRGKTRKFKSLTDEPSNGHGRTVLVAEVIESNELLELLDALFAAGHALTIGRTTDGGAIALAFLVGGKPVKRYIPDRSKWLDLLAELAD